MSVKKKGLGKGLSALVQENIVEPMVEISPDVSYLEKSLSQGVLVVDPNKVLPSRYQPRKEFDQAFLEELAESIKKHGVIQPLVVSDLGNGSYELVAGERRLRASKLAGLNEVPVVVREFEEKDRLAVALIENIQRADLNALEVAEAYQEMIERLSLTQEEISVVVGKSRASVANTLRLLKLPDSIRKRIAHGNLSEGHGRAILALHPDYLKMEEVAVLVEDKDLSVRQTEELVKNVSQDQKNNDSKNEKSSSPIDYKMSSIEDKIVRILGVKTKVSGTMEKGSIRLFYHNQQELEVLMQNLTKKQDY